MIVYSNTSTPDCRVVMVPACDNEGNAAQDAPVEALACFQMRIRDTLDFRVDFTQWLAANGNAQLVEALYSVAEGSPSSPEIVGQAFVATGKTVVVIAAGEGAKAGDAFHIEVTAQIGATTPAQPSEVTIPPRVMVRRIHVVLING